jgi:eukaryotic-like serine/threonine-protein kinase
MRIARAKSSNAESINPLRLTLPAALLEKSVSRLCWISLMVASSTVVLFAVQGVLQPELAEVQHKATVRLMVLFIVLLSVGFMGLNRSGVLSKQALLNVGVSYQILIALGIAMIENSLPLQDAVVRGVSAVGIWICLCGMLIPNTPLVSLFSALASVSLWCVAHFVSCEVYGYTPLPVNRILAWMAPLVMCSAWVFVFNKQIFMMQIRQQQSEEMGAYRLDYRIGHGGMGEVWRASHHMLARNAAIKLIRSDVLIQQTGRQADVLRKRFEREARATASLQCPHTVALYDFGVTQDGSFYYVMELLNGMDLQTLVDRFGPFPAARVVSVLRQVCLSLEEAHRAGLIHRDIKPKNIFLCRLGLDFDFTKVLDFGLVKNTDRGKDASVMTVEGATTGTPAYMPPEMALGRADIDGRADIYALGCVAYFMLTGGLVFTETSPTAMALAHVQKPVVPPSQRAELGVPKELDALVIACLAKEPGDRPRSAQELNRLLDELSLTETWTRNHAAEWWHTNLPEASLGQSALIHSREYTNADAASTA